MRIAIDASRTTVEHVTGTEHYARQLIRALLEDHPQHITLYFRDTPPPGLYLDSALVQQRVITLPRLWTHLGFASALWRDRPDVTFVPAHTLPIFFPGRAVVTVHDLGFKYFPEAHPDMTRRYLDWTTRYSASRASIILADSHATAHDLTHFYGTPPEKIRVVYPGVDPPPVTDVEAVRKKYHLPARYFLFIGTLQPRKNIARIVQAYARWREQHPDDETGLVLAGGKGWLYEEAWIEGVPNIHLPGYIDEADKGALYAGALALIFPSLYEGFGFPVIEAMHCGTPVIASSTSSLPELVGKAGLLVDPLDTEAIAKQMAVMTDDEARWFQLREAGYQQAAQFTWEAAAEQVAAILEAVATA
ncbi:MAG: glycosyltransferase family 4 protein [Anaerolineae bacterium]|nr:glycosyltransferase family 4 protein [Anaerolineae bacterium]